MYLETNMSAMFLTDDSSARIVAEQKNYRVHGTIGLLIRSIRKGLKHQKKLSVSSIQFLINLHYISSQYFLQYYSKKLKKYFLVDSTLYSLAFHGEGYSPGGRSRTFGSKSPCYAPPFKRFYDPHWMKSGLSSGSGWHRNSNK